MFSDKFREYSLRKYAARREYIAKNTADIIAAQKDDMRTALEYLYGTLPLDDVRFTPFEWMEEVCAAALATRAANQYGVDIPEDIFAQYVLCPRVNNERAQRHRRFFAEKLKARVQGKSIADAALSVNLWCCEQVTYHSSDDRTEGPITAYLSGIGRCGEESAFAVCALRSAGIPARQVYSPWWSHCDDNHAWVEVYTGDGWHYMGACEPEYELDRGWFMAASRRAMLVHSRAFSSYTAEGLAGEELIEKRGEAYLFNQTARYADTVELNISVVCGNAPVCGAKVHIQLLNMAAYRDIAVLTTDGEGRAQLRCGKGSIHISIEHNGAYFERDIDTSICTQVMCEPGEFVQGYTSGIFRAPQSAPSNRTAADKAKQTEMKAAVANAASTRERRINAYYDEFTASHKCSEVWLPYIRAARGNADEIGAFLLSQGEADMPYALKMLQTISEKDMRDTDAATLMYHMKRVLPNKHGMDDSLFINYVLCPHIGMEPICKWDEEGLSMLDANSAAVAKLRLSGMPARLSPVTGAAEYMQNGRWTPLNAVPMGRLELAGDGLKQGESWAMTRLKDGEYLPLNMGELPLCMDIPAGKYALMVTNRLPSGDQQYVANRFELSEGERLGFTLVRPKAELSELLGHTALCDAIVYDKHGQAFPLASLCAGNAALIALLQPGGEPTEHFLNELYDAYERLSAVCRVVIVLPSSGSSSPAYVRFADKYGRIDTYIDADEVQEPLARAAFKEPGDYPLLFLIGGYPDCRFASAGYSVGSVELIIKLAALI